MSKRRSGNLQATSDPLIDELLANPNYDVREDGTIWTLIAVNGKPSKVWRKAGSSTRDHEYVHIKYNHKNLKVHRIVYRKFHGKLKQDLVVDHIDGNGLNNRPENLRLVTQQRNIESSLELTPYADRVIELAPEALIIEARKQGLTHREICLKFGLPRTTVQRVLAKAGYVGPVSKDQAIGFAA